MFVLKYILIRLVCNFNRSTSKNKSVEFIIFCLNQKYETFKKDDAIDYYIYLNFGRYCTEKLVKCTAKNFIREVGKTYN